MKLQELEDLVANLGAGGEVVTDQAFEDRLKEAEKEVTALLREAQDAKGTQDPAVGSFLEASRSVEVPPNSGWISMVL